MKGSREGRANEDKRARARTILFVSPFNARVNTRTSLKDIQRASGLLESSREYQKYRKRVYLPRTRLPRALF